MHHHQTFLRQFLFLAFARVKLFKLFDNRTQIGFIFMRLGHGGGQTFFLGLGCFPYRMRVTAGRQCFLIGTEIIQYGTVCCIVKQCCCFKLAVNFNQLLADDFQKSGTDRCIVDKGFRPAVRCQSTAQDKFRIVTYDTLLIQLRFYGFQRRGRQFKHRRYRRHIRPRTHQTCLGPHPQGKPQRVQ